MAKYTLKEFFLYKNIFFEDYYGDDSSRKPILPPRGNTLSRYIHRLSFGLRRSHIRAYCLPRLQTITSKAQYAAQEHFDEENNFDHQMTEEPVSSGKLNPEKFLNPAENAWEKGVYWAKRKPANTSKSNFKEIIGFRFLNLFIAPYFLIILTANTVKYGLYIPLKSFCAEATDWLIRRLRFETWRHTLASIALMLLVSPLLIPISLYFAVRTLQATLCLIGAPLFLLAKAAEKFFAPLEEAYRENKKEVFWPSIILSGMLVAGYITCCIFTSGIALFAFPFLTNLTAASGIMGTVIISGTIAAGFIAGVSLLSTLSLHFKNFLGLIWHCIKNLGGKNASDNHLQNDQEENEPLNRKLDSSDNNIDRLSISLQSSQKNPPASTLPKPNETQTKTISSPKKSSVITKEEAAHKQLKDGFFTTNAIMTVFNSVDNQNLTTLASPTGSLPTSDSIKHPYHHPDSDAYKNARAKRKTLLDDDEAVIENSKNSSEYFPEYSQN